jgi:tRNA A37 methylthiotransferase MiaB
LIELGNKLSYEYKKKFIDKEVEVLIENYNSKTNTYHGITSNYLDVDIESSEDLINKICQIKYKIQ